MNILNNEIHLTHLSLVVKLLLEDGFSILVAITLRESTVVPGLVKSGIHVYN
jgi:hypothetical protein